MTTDTAARYSRATRRPLPPRDARGRFVSARRLACAADRAQAHRSARRSALAHWACLVVLPWAAIAWLVLP